MGFIMMCDFYFHLKCLYTILLLKSCSNQKLLELSDGIYNLVDALRRFFIFILCVVFFKNEKY